MSFPARPHESVRPSPIFLALLAVTAAGGALAWLAGSGVRPLSYVGVFVFVVAGWLVSLCLHEFGHALTAWRFGDHDAAVRGYLTLDPRRYSHPALSLVLPMVIILLGGIGLPGAAVYLRTWFMTPARRTLVSLAGPAANLLLAVLLLTVVRLFFDPAHAVLWAGVAFLAFLQLTALVLNLLPIPGLDGYDALEPHLSPETQRAVAPAKQYGYFVLLFLLFAPGLNRWFFGMVLWLFDLSGVPHVLVAWGDSLTRFWSAWF
ncbi:site-2 protease family protein [Mycobacterium helveticum]|uniref:Site-2 protease family protein n=1 Tax=Mycobacterium helveticum TaxID=2592811 RepID=A0A557XYL4_9MYCO|nr:site-2 protease family protein [Mycobacterium helveticum]TVS86665.1 site-2 protease family protein [Mycobacterium helveticum]TVS91268.1 site-2 protease family protein [Mycobacterium helveticum]